MMRIDKENGKTNDVLNHQRISVRMREQMQGEM